MQKPKSRHTHADRLFKATHFLQSCTGPPLMGNRTVLCCLSQMLTQTHCGQTLLLPAELPQRLSFLLKPQEVQLSFKHKQMNTRCNLREERLLSESVTSVVQKHLQVATQPRVVCGGEEAAGPNASRLPDTGSLRQGAWGRAEDPQQNHSRNHREEKQTDEKLMTSWTP